MNKRTISILSLLFVLTVAFTGCEEVETEEPSDMNGPVQQDVREQTEEEPMEEPMEEQAAQPEDEDQTMLIKQAFSDKYGNPVDEVSVEISSSTDTHMRGVVKIGPPGTISGGMFLAAKVNDEWMIVHDGQGVYTCAEVAPFNFPEEMINDCYEGP
jgi:hypothetical protein